MQSLMIQTLEIAINKYLSMDSNVLTELDTLNDKIIKVDITDWDIQLFLQPTQNGFNIYDKWYDEPNTVICGKLASLLRTGMGPIDSKAVMDNAITLNGDMETGEKIRDILNKIDIDWEAQLSQITGDTLAYHIANGVSGALDFLKTRKESLQNQTRDYVLHEAQLTPTKEQLDSFYNGINETRHATERLEVKLQQHLAQQES